MRECSPPSDPTPTERRNDALIRVRLPSTFAARIGGDRSLDVVAPSVDAALHQVTARHPVLAPLIWLKGHALNPVIMIFHNEILIRDESLATTLTDGDVVDVVPAVESG